MGNSSKEKGDRYEIASLELIKRIQHELGVTDVLRDSDLSLSGASGTSWTPDLIAYRSNQAEIAIECRFRGPRSGGVKQADMGGFAYSLLDTGVKGIIITSRPPQKGACSIAEAEQIGVIEFQPGDSFDEYVCRTANFLRNHFFLGTSDSLELSDECCIELEHKDGTTRYIQ